MELIMMEEILGHFSLAFGMLAIVFGLGIFCFALSLEEDITSYRRDFLLRTMLQCVGVVLAVMGVFLSLFGMEVLGG